MSFINGQAMLKTTGFGPGFSCYNGKKYPAYCGSKVYDDHTKNVHLHPDDPDISLSVGKEYGAKMEGLEDLIAEVLRKRNIKYFAVKTNKSNRNPDTIYLIPGFGKKGGNGELCGIYKCRAYWYNNKCYSCMPYRIYRDNGKISSVMKAFQFSIDHTTNSINKGEHDRFDCCYPESYAGGASNTNSLGHLVKNACSNYSDTYAIANEFVDFILKN